MLELQSRGFNDVNKPMPPEEPQPDGAKKRKRAAKPKFKTFTELRNELKRLEIERVQQESPNDEVKKQAALVGFVKQSVAEFKFKEW